MALGHVTSLAADGFEIETIDAATVLHNGDALTWSDLQGQLQGVPVNVATALGERRWRVMPNRPMAELTRHHGLRKGAEVARNRDMAWERLLEKKSAERRIGVRLRLEPTPEGHALTISDERGAIGRASAAGAHEVARDPIRAEAAAREHLSKLGATIFEATSIDLAWPAPRFIPPSTLNALRRDALAALEAARAKAWQRLPRAKPVEPPVPYPEDTLSYLANVYNHQAAAFYARHGVKIVDAAYESHEEHGDVSLMITKHCVRWSLSLCPKQAKGVIGVQGTVRAEPLTLVQGDQRFMLRFDCKPCEMHVVGRLQRQVLHEAAKQAVAQPMTFYRRRPAAGRSQASPG
jgi:putative protease